MKWLEDNPLGRALAAISGVFILLALVMAIIWNLPVSVEIAETETEDQDGDVSVLTAHQVAPLRDLLVVNEKPVFNESRLPQVDVDVDEDELAEDATVAVKDAPDVRLTGVIITSGMRIASLTPAKEDIKSIMAHEGQALTGEFVGWQVSVVNPRTVVLESRDGQKLELDLQVHDVKIKEPPKPAPAKTAQAESGQGEQMVDEDGEPLSRAEQIRQRIAERREELRLEQEEQAQAQDAAGGEGKPPKVSSYQAAIRAMMNNKNKDQDSNDKKDG